MSCPICAATEGWPFPHAASPQIEAWRAEIGETDRYFWTLCRGCGNGYPSVPPDPRVLASYWAANRVVDTLDDAGQAAVWRYRIDTARLGAQRVWRTYAPLFEGRPGKFEGRFLDVACGLGETVDLFRRQGWTSEGIDVDAATKRFHDALGIVTRIGRFEDDASSSQYDLILIAHAIYFITDPLEFLRQVKTRLAPGGIFAIVISDLLASTDNGKPAYAHTFYPCASSMRAALARAGFETLFTRTLSGSIYLAAKPAENIDASIDTRLINLRWRSKPLRHAVLGRPNMALRRAAKRLLGQGR